MVAPMMMCQRSQNTCATWLAIHARISRSEEVRRSFPVRPSKLFTSVTLMGSTSRSLVFVIVAITALTWCAGSLRPQTPPSTDARLLIDGVAAFRRGDFHAAQLLLANLLQRNPNSEEACFWL